MQLFTCGTLLNQERKGFKCMAVLPLLIALIYVPVIGISIACLVLFIKLSLRGIKALDIYIENNGRN